MNTKLIHEVADTIERLEFGHEQGKFKMMDYTHWLTDSCRSPACIAGWTCYIADGEVARPRGDDGDGVHERAADLLRIPDCKANDLFAPSRQVASYMAPLGAEGHISPARAAATLRRLADTGVVDWGTDDG